MRASAVLAVLLSVFLTNNTASAQQPPLSEERSELLLELICNTEKVATLIRQQNFGAVWYPTLRAKDAALALDQHHVSDLLKAKRPLLHSAVKRLTISAWQIERAADTGEATKLLRLQVRFSDAAEEIQELYATR
jgi:hypothetical protein